MAFRCPWKGRIVPASQIVVGAPAVGGITSLYKLIHNGFTYLWRKYDPGGGFIIVEIPGIVYSSLYDPNEPKGKFIVPTSGISGTVEPDWDITGDNDPPIFDNDIAWRVISGFAGVDSWAASTSYAIDQTIEIDDNPPLYGRVEGFWDTCVRSQCRLWDSAAMQCGAAPNLGGGASGPIPAFGALVGEYQGNEDLDDNNLIYGKDFMIDPDDPDKPPALVSMEQDPDWVDPTSTMTWAEYLASIGP